MSYQYQVNENKQRQERLIDPEKIIKETFDRIKVIQKVNQKLQNNIEYNQLPAAKKELQKAKETIVEDTHMIKTNIEQLKQINMKDFNKQKKIMEDKFDQALKTFQTLAKDITQMQYHYRKSTTQIYQSQDSDEQQQVQGQNDQEQFQVYEKTQFEAQILQERQSELNNIEKLVNQVNAVMNEAADQVEGQQQMINVIVENVQETQQNVIKAEDQLQKANKDSKKVHNKYICFIGVILLIVAILLSFFFLLN